MAEIAIAAIGRRRAAPQTREGFLAAHFRDLQGLRTVAFFAILPAFFVFERLASSFHRLMSHGELVAVLVSCFLVALMCILGGLFVAPRWYRAKYGFVAGPYGVQFHTGALKWGMWALALLYSGCLITCSGDQLFALLAYGLTGAGLALNALLRVCEKLPPIASIRSRRWIYVWALVASMMPIVLARTTHPTTPGMSGWDLLPASVAWVAAGLYDHWLLGHLSRAGVKEVTDAA